jgi:ribosomal protein S17E
MSSRPLCSKAGFEKYLLKDVQLTLRNDRTKTILYKSSLNQKNSSWYNVIQDNKIIKIHWKELLKPGCEKQVYIKPQHFGVSGIYRTPDDVAKQIYNSLDNIDEYNRQHLILLLASKSKYIRNKINTNNLQDELAKYKCNPDKPSIAKDFGEILGVLYLNENEIYFPEDLNNSLFDYEVNGKKYSAKTKPSCNTVKFKDIVNLIPEDLNEHWVTRLVNQFQRYRIIDKIPVKIANKMIEDYQKQFMPSDLTGRYYWTKISNDNIDSVVEFYNTITKDKIYNITCDIINGDSLIKVEKPKRVLIRIKEYKESIGFDLKF